MLHKMFSFRNDYQRIPNDLSVSDKRGKIDYDISNHFNVIFKLYGSIWPKVLPYCIINTLIILFIECKESVVSINDGGHNIMSLMVSFLLITRCSISYKRWTDSRKLLSSLTESSRELAHFAVTFTRYNTSATYWRYQMCRQTIILLRVIVSVLQYDTKHEKIWDISELSDQEKKALAHGVGGAIERAPFLLALFLRTTIASHTKSLETPIDDSEEMILYACMDRIMSSYQGLVKHINTPFPFPLMQMTRTFLVLWVASLPLALVHDITNKVPVLLITFFITYGFLGLEFVCIEIDDPFGKKENCFDCLGLAKVVFDDISIALQDIDGEEVSDSLKEFVLKPQLLRRASVQKAKASLKYSQPIIMNSILLEKGNESDFADLELFQNQEIVTITDNGIQTRTRNFSLTTRGRLL